MPQTLPNKAIDIYKGLIKETWVPVFRTFSEDKTYKALYGGMVAYMEPGATWPMHTDGLPMAVVFQADTDSLPLPIIDKFGGRGKVFQLFMPLGEGDDGPRHWSDEGDEIEFFFTVRILDKEAGITPEMMPPVVDQTLYAQPKFIHSWDRRLDLPFRHGGPYDTDIEASHEAWEEVVSAMLGDDPSDEQYERVANQLYHSDDKEAGMNSDLTGFNEWGDKIGGWPSLEQGPTEGIDETWDHVLQFNGGIGSGELKELSEEIAWDGHGWLCRNPDGEWVWYSVMG